MRFRAARIRRDIEHQAFQVHSVVLKFRALFIALAAALAATPSAGAAVLHVTDGAGNCKTQALGCTLATALSTAASGDTVRVHSGVHAVTGVLTDNAPGVSIEGAP